MYEHDRLLPPSPEPHEQQIESPNFIGGIMGSLKRARDHFSPNGQYQDPTPRHIELPSSLLIIKDELDTVIESSFENAHNRESLKNKVIEHTKSIIEPFNDVFISKTDINDSPKKRRLPFGRRQEGNPTVSPKYWRYDKFEGKNPLNYDFALYLDEDDPSRISRVLALIGTTATPTERLLNGHAFNATGAPELRIGFNDDREISKISLDFNKKGMTCLEEILPANSTLMDLAKKLKGSKSSATIIIDIDEGQISYHTSKRSDGKCANLTYRVVDATDGLMIPTGGNPLTNKTNSLRVNEFQKITLELLGLLPVQS